METRDAWKEYFRRWPKEVPQRGVVVTSFGEQVPFEGFATSDSFVVLERKTPDTSGARKVILPYEQVAGLKLTDVIRMKALEPLGFAVLAKE